MPDLNIVQLLKTVLNESGLCIRSCNDFRLDYASSSTHVSVLSLYTCSGTQEKLSL